MTIRPPSTGGTVALTTFIPKPVMNILSCSPEKFPRVFLVGATLALASPLTALADKDGEWFDPTDWFDNDNAKAVASANDDYGVYDYDFNYGLGDDFDYAVWSNYERWEGKGYEARLWDKQKWSDSTRGLDKPDGDPLRYTIHADARGKDRDDDNRREKERAEKKSSDTKGNLPRAGHKHVAHLEGTVEGLTNVRLSRESGAVSTYTLAKVRLAKNENTVVNLGREALVQDLGLKKGDTIEAIGRRGEIDGQDVFVAHRLKSGNRTIDANPTIRLENEALNDRSKGRADRDDKRSRRSGKEESVTGTVQQLKQPSASSDQTKHTLVSIELKNGKSTWIDFGPVASLQKIGLDEGDQITVRGRTDKQGGREVLVPDLVKIEDPRGSGRNSQ